jgi:hypothetical protein
VQNDLATLATLATLAYPEHQPLIAATAWHCHDHEGLVQLFDSDPSSGINPS